MTRAIVLALAVTAVFAGPAAAAVGDWVDGDKARVRLVAVPAADGRLDGAIEVELQPGWKTYWRSPGASGIAPVMDFSASTNLAATPEVAFPVPERYDDGFGVSNVHEGRLVLPFTVPVRDAAAATELRLSLDIGVCEVVCIPAHFDVALTVPPGKADGEAAAAIAEARAAIPGPAADDLGADSIRREGGTDKRPIFDVALRVPAGDEATVYVEGPADWFAAVPERLSAADGKAVYRVKFDRLGAKTPIPGAHFRVTIAVGDRAVETTLALD